MARKSFVNSPYFPDAEGRLRPTIPRSCPRDRSGAGCEVVLAGSRERVHGPGFPLAIAFCFNHSHYFTIYPPGWVPYGRLPLVPVSAGGAPVLDETERYPWRMTLFAPLLAAAQGVEWPVELNRGACDEVVGAPGCLQTQKRYLDLSLRILGISKTTYRRGREISAADLDVDLGLVNEAWRRSRMKARDGPVLRRRGAEGAKILEAIVLSEQVTSNLLRRWQRESRSSTSPAGTRIGRP